MLHSFASLTSRHIGERTYYKTLKVHYGCSSANQRQISIQEEHNSQLHLQGGSYAPVARVKKWLTRSAIAQGQPGPLYRSFKGNSPHIKDQPPTYAIVRTWCLSAAVAASINNISVGTDSLRKSALTATASSNVPTHITLTLYLSDKTHGGN